MWAKIKSAKDFSLPILLNTFAFDGSHWRRRLKPSMSEARAEKKPARKELNGNDPISVK